MDGIRLALPDLRHSVKARRISDVCRYIVDHWEAHELGQRPKWDPEQHRAEKKGKKGFPCSGATIVPDVYESRRSEREADDRNENGSYENLERQRRREAQE